MKRRGNVWRRRAYPSCSISPWPISAWRNLAKPCSSARALWKSAPVTPKRCSAVVRSATRLHLFPFELLLNESGHLVSWFIFCQSEPLRKFWDVVYLHYQSQVWTHKIFISFFFFFVVLKCKIPWHVNIIHFWIRIHFNKQFLLFKIVKMKKPLLWAGVCVCVYIKVLKFNLWLFLRSSIEQHNLYHVSQYNFIWSIISNE